MGVARPLPLDREVRYVMAKKLGRRHTRAQGTTALAEKATPPPKKQRRLSRKSRPTRNKANNEATAPADGPITTDAQAPSTAPARQRPNDPAKAQAKADTSASEQKSLPS